MDANAAAGGGEKTAVASRESVAAPSSPRAAEAMGGEQRPAELSGGAAGADGGLAVNAERGAAGDKEEYDEQQAVERFNALVANVRAMRGMYRSSGDGASADSGNGGNAVGGGGEKKRARRANQPWRPVFRMEDFADAGAATRSARADDGARALPVEQTAGVEGDDGVEPRSGRRAAASSSSSPPPHLPRRRRRKP
ncbi:hypothetical protein E2562_022026 [Oryza meyeriana var. granulata]|uniref:Uncharacterized protein n=1 Tax=Oryza meyeriana var. granulata TaxID=110450 RepID=A0A6G1ENI9_9ORYZ|nr:hypothetical protein E2562_022026 [Oryza meyeriana var. granulata]